MLRIDEGGEFQRVSYCASELSILSLSRKAERIESMLTLYELKNALDDAISNGIPPTPRWSVLRKSDVGVLTEVAIDDNAMLQVYNNGLVLYETSEHHTVFPITDALTDYTYDSVVRGKDGKDVIAIDVFYNMPWVFRVLIEAEDRVVHNMYTSPTIEGCISLTSVMEQILRLRDGSGDALEVLIERELLAALKESEYALTEYQKFLINALYKEDRSVKELTSEVETSRQAIEDVISRALINMRKVFRDMGYEIEASLLKYK